MKHLKFLTNHKSLLVITIFASVVASVMEAVGISLIYPLLQGVGGVNASNAPFPFNHIVSFFDGFSLSSRLQLIALFLVGIVACKGYMLFLKSICSYKLLRIISVHFQMECFKQLMRMGMGYFNSQKGGDIHTIINVHTNNIGVSMSRFSQALHLPITIIMLLVMLSYLSWQVTLVSIFLSILLAFSVRGLMRKTDSVSRTLTSAVKLVGSSLLNAIAGLKVIHMFNREAEETRKIESVIKKEKDVKYEIGRLQSQVEPVTQFVGVICLALIIVSASLFMVRPDGTGIDSMLVFLVAFSRIIAPVLSINNIRIAFLGDLPYYKDVFQFLDSSDKKYIKNGKSLFIGLQHKIEFRDVCFGYNPQHSTVLDKISFSLSKGTKVGVVGPSGGGKSTLTELILRFYDPQSGQILIDGTDLRKLDICSWRKRIGVVSQDVFLFNDTIRANIAYAKPEATQEEIESAARKAHAHGFIGEQPQGYDTLIGDRGVLLSGGQKQRLAIARAIIIDPEILIFDEATSALDSESEKIVQKALDEVGKGRTVIAIAHRLSTLSDADNIIVMNAGRIVEQGTHQELLQHQGLYNKLVKMQSLGKDE